MNIGDVRDSEAPVRNVPDWSARRYNMDRTVTAVLVAAIMAMSCCVLLVSDEGDAETTTVGNYQDLLDAIGNSSAGETIQLIDDIEVNAMVNINEKNSIILDLNNHTITSSAGFTGTDNENNNDKHLINVDSSSVTITNGVLKTTTSNKHVLNVYDNSDVTLSNVTLDHTNAMAGAPLVVNGSKVTLEGKNTFITGDKSWYAVNIDNKTGKNVGASVSTTVGSELIFNGSKPIAFYLEATGKENAENPSSSDIGPIRLTFSNGTKVYSDNENFVLKLVNESTSADITVVGSDAVDINPEPEPTPEPTPTPGYDDDEDLPPFIPTQSAEDDDTVTIVACAAAAAVAAILAVFLVIDRK